MDFAWLIDLHNWQLAKIGHWAKISVAFSLVFSVSKPSDEMFLTYFRLNNLNSPTLCIGRVIAMTWSKNNYLQIVKTLINDDEFRFNDASTHEGHLRQNGELTWFCNETIIMISHRPWSNAAIWACTILTATLRVWVGGVRLKWFKFYMILER